jgi:hypothetical protein
MDQIALRVYEETSFKPDPKFGNRIRPRRFLRSKSSTVLQLLNCDSLLETQPNLRQLTGSKETLITEQEAKDALRKQG